jgi:hypothetical protein
MRMRGRATSVAPMYIHPEFEDMFARQRQRDVVSAADRNRRFELTRRHRHDASSSAERRRWLDATGEITIRPAVRADSRALARLAILDSATPLDGDVLLAEVEGVVWAASSLADGRTIGDPFRSTLATRALLELRREQIASAKQGHVPPERRRRWLRQLRLGS